MVSPIFPSAMPATGRQPRQSAVSRPALGMAARNRRSAVPLQRRDALPPRCAVAVGRQCRRAVLRGRRRSRRHSPRARSVPRVTGAPTRCSRISSAPPIRSSCSRATRTSIRQPNTAAISRSANSAKTARCSAASATMSMRSRCSAGAASRPIRWPNWRCWQLGDFVLPLLIQHARLARLTPRSDDGALLQRFEQRWRPAARRCRSANGSYAARCCKASLSRRSPTPSHSSPAACAPISARAREARRGEPGRAVRVVRDRRRTTGDRGQ